MIKGHIGGETESTVLFLPHPTTPLSWSRGSQTQLMVTFHRDMDPLGILTQGAWTLAILARAMGSVSHGTVDSA